MKAYMFLGADVHLKFLEVYIQLKQELHWIFPTNRPQSEQETLLHPG